MGLLRRPGPTKPSVLRQRRRIASAALATCLALVVLLGLSTAGRRVSAPRTASSSAAGRSGAAPAALVGRISSGVGAVSLGPGGVRAGDDGSSVSVGVVSSSSSSSSSSSLAASLSSSLESDDATTVPSSRYVPSPFTYERLPGDSAPSNLTRASLSLRDALLSSWPQGKPKGCFFALVRSTDADALAVTMEELDRKFNGRDEALYPYVFVNDEEFTPEFVEAVRGSTRAPTLFGRVPESQWRAPDWIDARRVDESLRAIGHLPHGGQLSYRSMCRYYARFFQHHELLDGFEYAWRIEAGVRFRCEMPDDAFRVMSDNGYAYGWNIIAHEIMETVAGLWATASQHWTRRPADLAERNTLKPLFNAWPKGGARAATAAAARWARGSALGAERHEQVLDVIDESGKLPDQYDWPLLEDQKALEANGQDRDPAFAALKNAAEAGRHETAEWSRAAAEASRIAKRKAKETAVAEGADVRWNSGAAADLDGSAILGGALGVAKTAAAAAAARGNGNDNDNGIGASRAAQIAAETSRARKATKRSWAERRASRVKRAAQGGDADADDADDAVHAGRGSTIARLSDGGTERTFLQELARRQNSEKNASASVDRALALLAADLEQRDVASEGVGRSLLDGRDVDAQEGPRARTAAPLRRPSQRFESLGSRQGHELRGGARPALPAFQLDDVDAPATISTQDNAPVRAHGARADATGAVGASDAASAAASRRRLRALDLDDDEVDAPSPLPSSSPLGSVRRLLGSLFGRRDPDPYHLNCTTHPEWHLPVSPVHALPGPRREALEAAASWRARRAVKAGLGGAVPQYVGYHFWSNFEIVELAWLRSEAYDAYVGALDDSGGFFYERWGDAPVRSLAVAALLDAERVRFFDEIGYTHAPWTHCPRVGAIRKRCDCSAAEDENVRRQSYPFSVWVAEHDKQAAKAPGGAAELAQPGGKKRDADDPWKKTGDDPFKGSLGDPETGV